MKRVNGDGATVDNKFTNGDPILGIPATTVNDSWLNSIQEELAFFIEEQGITLDQTNSDLTQFKQALDAFVGSGGVSVADFTIPNNITTPTDVTGLVFDKAETKSAKFLIDIFRKTATEKFKEVGDVFAVYDPEDDDWDITLNTNFDDAGVIFSITSAGQVQFTSSNMSGGSYSGTLKMKNIVKVEI